MQIQKTQGLNLFHLPHVGQRIFKTALAVFLCLFIYWLRGYQGESMPTESAITAIICMQHYAQDSRRYALNRFIGSFIGAFFGLLLLLLLAFLPRMGQNVLLLYALMALGVLLSLYTTVLLRVPDTAGLAAIVFLCIVISFPDIENPLQRAGLRMLDIFIGTTVAITVNVFRLPRRKNRHLVFFVRTRDLVVDRFTPIPPAVLFRLNYLYNDGARICLMSEHAPAFFSMQLCNAHLNTPQIVMDGAALYDPLENVYLQAETMPTAALIAVRSHLDGLGISYFLYTVHNGKTCIFHRGQMRPEEKTIYERMRRSPYRSYLEGEVFSPSEIVYLKIIVKKEEIPALLSSVEPILPKDTLRSVVRAESSAPNIHSFYLYSKTATFNEAVNRLMAYLHREDPALYPVVLNPRTEKHTERSALQLLHQVERQYEPLAITERKRLREEAESFLRTHGGELFHS